MSRLPTDWPEWEDDPVEVSPPANDGDLSPSPFIWVEPNKIPRREWLYGRHLIRRYVSTTISPGGLGKSSLLLAEALAMASGEPFLGERIHGPALKVWYWNGEDDNEETQRRAVACAMHHKLTPDRFAGRLWTDTGREKDVTLASVVNGQLTVNTETLDEIERHIVANGIDVLILDPFVATHAIGENDNMGINAVIRALARLAGRCNCAVEIVHHVRKPPSGTAAATDVNDARGASALIGGVRSARVLNVMSLEEAELIGIEPGKRFGYFRVDNGKANLAPREDKAVWRRIVGYDLENGGQALDSSDHVGVVTAFELPGEWSGLPANAAYIAQFTAARNDHARLDHKSPDWFGHIVGPDLGIDTTEKGGITRLKKLIDAWIKSGTLMQQARPDRNRVPRAFIVPGADYVPAHNGPEPFYDTGSDCPF